MPKNIAKIVMDCCKKLGIEYSSVHVMNENKREDIFKLRDIYLQLKEIESDLIVIADRNNIPELKTLLKDDIQRLDIADHDILRMAQMLARRTQ